MVKVLTVAYVDGVPTNEYVGGIYKSDNITWRVYFTFNQVPSEVKVNYELPSGVCNTDEIPVTEYLEITSDMSLYRGSLKIVPILIDGEQKLYCKPCYVGVK